jgi:zinc protease
VRAARAHANSLRFELDGGALALLEPSHDVPLVTLVVALRSGSAADPTEKAGLARIAARMLRRGCEGLVAEQIDFRIDALGAEMAVETSPSTVAIHAQVIARNLDALVDLLARMISTPTFPEEELGRLKRETVSEIIEARDNDRVVAQKAMQRSLFAGHPYGLNAGGTTQTVPRIDRSDIVAFFRRYVVSGNLVVAFAGDVTPDRVPALAARLLAGVPRGPAATQDVPEPTMASGRRLLLVDKPERTQTQILLGTLGTSPSDDDHVPLLVANAIFGGTFTSRLMKEIRSKRGWSYGASARAGIDRRRQAWILWTFPAAQDVGPCLKLSIELLEQWVTGGVTGREVSFIQRYLARSHAFDVDTATKRMHQTLDIDLLGLPLDYFSGWVAHVGSVTAESASTAVKNRIDVGRLLAVVVGTATEVLEPLRSAVPSVSEIVVVPFDAE